MAGGIIGQDPDAGAPDPSMPQMPPIQGAQPTAPPAAAASPSQPAAPGLGQPPAAADAIGKGAGNTKGEIATPTVTPEYDTKKLAKAQTTLDLLNAMKPASRTDYMDWWQKQHGDIDQKYDQLKQSIGARPSEDEPQTQKEKFAALLEFGLHLMKASSAPSTNQGQPLANTLSDSVEKYQAIPGQNLAAAQKDYDTQANAIETARGKAQAGIGTAESAMKGQQTSDKDYAAETKDNAAAFKDLSTATTEKASAMGPATYAVGPGGVVHALTRDADGTSHAVPVTGIDGKPFAGKVLGRSTGSGIDKGGQDPAAVRTYKYATQVMGIDKNAAAPILGVKPSGNPTKDHAAVYKQVLQSTMGDDEKAKRVADQYTLDNYGAGAIPRANQAPIQAPGTPPAAALQGLSPGKVRDFGANGKWTLGIDGKPIRVGAGPQTIQ
jgi:hypothetical protein